MTFYVQETNNLNNLQMPRSIQAKNIKTAKMMATKTQMFNHEYLKLGLSRTIGGFINDVVAIRVKGKGWIDIKNYKDNYLADFVSIVKK